MGRNTFATIFSNTIIFTLCLITFEDIESEAATLPASQNANLKDPDGTVIHNYHNHNHKHYFFTLALDKALLTPENETTIDVLPTIYTGGAKELKCEDTTYKTERGSNDDNHNSEKETQTPKLRAIVPGETTVADNRVTAIPKDRKYIDFIIGETGDTSGKPQIQQSSAENKVNLMNYDSHEKRGKFKGRRNRGKATFKQDGQINDDGDDGTVHSSVEGRTRCDGGGVSPNEEFDDDGRYGKAKNEDGVNTASARLSVNGRARINNERNTYVSEYNNNRNVQYGKENIREQYNNEDPHNSDVYGVETDQERSNGRGRLSTGKEDRFVNEFTGKVENEGGGATGHKNRQYGIVPERFQAKPRPGNGLTVLDGNDEQANAQRPWIEGSIIEGRDKDRAIIANDNYGYVGGNDAVGENVRPFGNSRVQARGNIKNGGEGFRGESIVVDENEAPYGIRNGDMDDTKVKSICQTRGFIMKAVDGFRGESVVDENEGTYDIGNEYLDGPEIGFAPGTVRQNGNTYRDGSEGAVDDRNIYQGVVNTARRVAPDAVRQSINTYRDRGEDAVDDRGIYQDNVNTARRVAPDAVRQSMNTYRDGSEGAVDDRNIDQDVVNTARRVAPDAVRQNINTYRDRGEGAVDDRNIYQGVVNTGSGVLKHVETAANGNIADNNSDVTLGRDENVPPNNEILSDEGTLSSSFRDSHTSSMAGSRYPNGKQDLPTGPEKLSPRPSHFSTVDTESYIGSGNDNRLQNPSSRPQKPTDIEQNEEGVAFGLGNYDDLENSKKQRVTDVIYDGETNYGNEMNQGSLNNHNMPYDRPPEGNQREDQYYQTGLTGAPIEKPTITMWPCIRLKNGLIPFYQQVPCQLASSKCAKVILR